MQCKCCDVDMLCCIVEYDKTMLYLCVTFVVGCKTDFSLSSLGVFYSVYLEPDRVYSLVIIILSLW